MCISTPKTPDIPQPAARQAAQLPDNGSTAERTDLNAARRRALMATLLPGPGGAIGAPMTTNSGSAMKATLGA
jgi:hypothetical protein